jgi:DNA polymerase III delta prime subunit
MMLDRMEGNAELKTSVQQMLATRRLTHSVLLVGEAGLGTGFAARCIAADYLYPAGGAAAEALLRGECCRAVAKAGKRDSGTVETGIVREAISVSGMGSGGKYLVGQVTAMRSEIFNTSLSAEGRAVLLYHVERMNEESANALLKVMEEPPEGVLFLLTADSLASVLPTAASALRWHRCPPPTAPATARRRAWTKKQLHCTVSCSMVILARCWRSPGTKPAPHRWKRRWSLPAPLPPAIATPPLCCLPPTKRTRQRLLLC